MPVAAVAKKTKKSIDVTIAAAAGHATTVIAAAAANATEALAVAADAARTAVSDAANRAAKNVEESTARALAEFPDIREDIREIRSSQALMVQSLTSVVTETLNQYTNAEATRLGGIAKSVEEIKEHMKTQNGRLAQAESHIIRQNLVLFGIIGPAALAIGGYVVHAIILAGGILKLFGG
jgi:hypothetical protein